MSSVRVDPYVCDACNSYYRLIGYLGESGVERRLDFLQHSDPVATRRSRRAASLLRTRA